MREVSRFGLGPPDNACAMIQKFVEIVHQRLDFAGIVAVNSLCLAASYGGQPRAQLVERRETLSDLGQAGKDEDDGETDQKRFISEMHDKREMMKCQKEEHVEDGEQTHSAEQRSPKQARSKRSRNYHCAAPMR